MSKVTEECLGKSECTVEASNDFFGGDPCSMTPKFLSVTMKGYTSSKVPIDPVSITVPTGSTDTLIWPFLKGTTPAQAVISEGDTVVWRGGAFVPGATGVSGVTAVGNAIQIKTISDSYIFT